MKHSMLPSWPTWMCYSMLLCFCRCPFVCLSTGLCKSTEQIFTKPGVMMGHGPRRNQSEFDMNPNKGADPDISFITLFNIARLGIFFILTIFPGINPFILIKKKKNLAYFGLSVCFQLLHFLKMATINHYSLWVTQTAITTAVFVDSGLAFSQHKGSWSLSSEEGILLPVLFWLADWSDLVELRRDVKLQWDDFGA